MIRGLRLLPWVLDHRRESKQPTFCNCDKCPDVEQIRQQLGCGKLPASKRGSFSAPSHFPDSDGICPGYLVSLPQVIQIACLHSWRDSLVMRLEAQPSCIVMDGIDILSAEKNAVESHAIERATSGTH